MTAGRDSLFDEGPAACPFLALERDRERRADEPDPRHRCYATPTPEPRALAHQRAFCLTPVFTGCPIFQDWAVRAAARPVPMRPVPAVMPADDDAPIGEQAPPMAVEPPIDDGSAVEQVSLFDTPIVPAPEAAILPVAEPQGPLPPAREPVIAIGPVIPPPVRPSRPSSPLASGSSGAPAAQASAPRERGKPTLRKEDIVPAWERARYDLPSGDGRRRAGGGGDLFSRLTFVFIALAIISLAVLVVLLVPILLGSRPPGATATPTGAAVDSGSPSPSPTSSPTPGPTWLSYTIKLGDNLFRIAAQFGISYEQLLGANPQITNPDFIRAGDVINIPTPDYLPPSPTFAPPPTTSPSPS